jgi:signal transduction histidine kinase
VRKDGSLFWASVVITTLRDKAGHIRGFGKVTGDITERKQAELVMEKSRQDQLRFKDELLSNVSHELRSPLTAIKQFTTILLDGLAGELNPEQRRFQQIVLRNIEQLQALIDDLLEVTVLQTGKLRVEPENVSALDAVTDSFNTLRGTAHAKGIDLSNDLPPVLPSVFADYARLRQILIILLDNAIKFTPEGGAVRIHARVLNQDPTFVVFEVSDTGCGMSPETAERVFERLYQEEGMVETSRKGLGLGLFICRELVTRQGGKIWIQSQLGVGSTFSFTLPVFSLNNVLSPLIRNGRWPTESVALVMVKTCLLDGWPSRESQQAWSNEVRTLVQRCLLPDLDVLLPKMSSAVEGERFFVAAFADDKGASVLVKRIREQFERRPDLHQTNLSISYTLLKSFRPDVGESMDNIVTSLAAMLEEAIKFQIRPEAIE